MKLWVDDVRPAPDGYYRVAITSVFLAIAFIETTEKFGDNDIELIDLDYDAGEYAKYGGDYIKLLDWLEQTNRNYPIRIHSMNPVGRENMRRIIQRNGWKEVI